MEKDLEAKEPALSQSMPGALSSKSVLGIGAIGAIVASVCCIVPLLAFALGLGGVSVLVGLMGYRLYFLVASAIFLLLVTWFILRRRRACCTTKEQRLSLYLSPLVVLMAFGVTYGVINYVVPSLVYRSPTVELAASASDDTPLAALWELTLDIDGMT